MKTNGSMISRQRHINNAIRERQTPRVYPHPAAPRSHWPTLALVTPLPSLLSLPRMASFSSRLAQSLVGWIFCLWEAFLWAKQNRKKPWPKKTDSYRCVLTGSADPSLRHHRLFCLAAFWLSPSPLPFSPCFILHPPPLICLVKRTCRQKRAHRGTAVYLNPLMGSMGSEVLLEHWFKASLICQCNKPPPREQSDTDSLGAAHIWNVANDTSCLSCCLTSKTFSKPSCAFVRFAIITLRLERV